MAVKIKLKRMGKIRSPHYRIIVADARAKRDGRALEEIGKYHPKESPSLIDVKSERAQYWLGVGAQPTDPVVALLKVTGDWQKFKGLPGAEGTLRSAEAKADKSEKYNALLAEVHKDDDKSEAGAKKKSTKKSPAKKSAKPDDKADAKAGEKTESDEAKADDDKPAKKTAAKKAPAKKTAAKKAPAKKTAANKTAAEDAGKADEKAGEKADEKAEAADAPAEES